MTKKLSTDLCLISCLFFPIQKRLINFLPYLIFEFISNKKLIFLLLFNNSFRYLLYCSKRQKFKTKGDLRLTFLNSNVHEFILKDLKIFKITTDRRLIIRAVHN